MTSRWDRWGDFPNTPRPKPLGRPKPDPVPADKPKDQGGKKK